MRIEAALVMSLLVGCSFKFEVASSRTTLEEQIIGSFQELETDYVTTASVRAVDSEGNAKAPVASSDSKKRALEARQNMEFNRDDLEELRSEELIGEGKDGLTLLLPSTIGKQKSATKPRRRFAEFIVEEENRDRKILWERVIEQSPDLTASNLSAVRDEFSKTQIRSLKSGQWYQQTNSEWVRKQD
jgi:hypothetical protein